MSQGQDAAVKNPTQYYASLTVALCSGAGHTITWKTMFSTGFYILNRIKKSRKQSREDSKQNKESEN